MRGAREAARLGRAGHVPHLSVVSFHKHVYLNLLIPYPDGRADRRPLC